MADKNFPKPGSGGRLRGNKFTTKSGKTIRVRRSLIERTSAKKDAKALRKAERLKFLPKSRFKRILYHLNPKRMAKYWFSRDGGIMALKILGIAIVVMFFFLVGVFAYFRKDLPNLKDIDGNNIGGSVRYYDRTGAVLLWEDYDAVKRVPVQGDKISQDMKDATVAVEDRDFFKHSGFNVRGITRAAWNNAFGGSTQGGSTITQQLVKLTTPGFSSDRTVTRKVKELILSVELERSYSKQEILTGYLNSAPYGGIEYGVEVASRTYFNKSASELTLDEAAMLATIPKSPTFYGPYSQEFDKEAFIGRQHYVLDVMNEMGAVTYEEREAAKQVNTLAKIQPRQPKYTGIVAPWFVLAAKAQLENDSIGKTYNRGGWKVTTTINMDVQKIAEEEVSKGLKQVARQGGDTAAFVAEDVKTGQVVALVGGADFNDKSRAGEINFAQQPLPPGSSFKPYDYLALIENTENSGAGSVLYDTQGPLEGYPCTNKSRPKSGGNCLYNYDFRYPGPLSLRYSLGGSRNVPAVKSMLAVGVKKTIDTADKLGLKDENGIGGYKCFSDQELKQETECYGSSAIGDGAFLNLDKHVHAYSTISRNGSKIPQTYIMKVEDVKNKIIKEWKQSNGEQVVRADSAYIVADMLSDPKASYMAKKIHDYKGHSFSVKTGTTNDSKDGWMMGFSTQYSVGVWVGYHTRQKVMSGFMENMTQPIWNGFMTRAHDNLTPEKRARPAGIQVLPAFVVRTHVGASSREPSPTNDIFPSWYKKPGKKQGQSKTIDKVSGKIATECTPELAKEVTTDGAAASFSSDPFVGAGTGSEDKDDVHKCDDVRPTATILTPNDLGNGSYTITANVVQGTHPLSGEKFKGTLNFKANGQPIPNGSFEISSSGSTNVTYTATTSGDVTFTVDVTDSVLYSASDSISISVVAGSGDDEEARANDNQSTYSYVSRTRRFRNSNN